MLQVLPVEHRFPPPPEPRHAPLERGDSRLARAVDAVGAAVARPVLDRCHHLRRPRTGARGGRRPCDRGGDAALVEVQLAGRPAPELAVLQHAPDALRRRVVQVLVQLGPHLRHRLLDPRVADDLRDAGLHVGRVECQLAGMCEPMDHRNRLFPTVRGPSIHPRLEVRRSQRVHAESRPDAPAAFCA